LRPTAAPDGAWQHVAEMVKQVREKQTEAENNGQIDPLKVKRFQSRSSHASQDPWKRNLFNALQMYFFNNFFWF